VFRAGGAPPLAGLAAKVVRAADRWRGHDPEGSAASDLAAALKALGERDLVR
jgi:hypothetical protein